MLYLAAYLGALGFASDWTFKGALSPLGEILAAPIFFSFGGLGIRRGIASWVGAKIDRSKNPVSFWVTTVCILFLGLMLLVWGLQDLGQS
jgi:hypothetical protein